MERLGDGVLKQDAALVYLYRADGLGGEVLRTLLQVTVGRRDF